MAVVQKGGYNGGVSQHNFGAMGRENELCGTRCRDVWNMQGVDTMREINPNSTSVREITVFD